MGEEKERKKKVMEEEKRLAKEAKEKVQKTTKMIDKATRDSGIIAVILLSAGILLKSIASLVSGIGLLIVVLIFFLSSFRIVKKTEIANKVWFEKMYDFCGSGLCRVPRLPHCGLVKIPKTRLKLDYDPRLVISKKGEWEGEEYKKQFLTIDATVYTEFKRDFDGIKSAVERGTPISEEELKNYTDGMIDSALRTALGEFNWGKATETEGRDAIKNVVGKRIEDENSVFQLGGLNIGKTEIALKVVDLESKELKEAFAEPDRQRLQAQGAVYEAERLKTETEIVGDIWDVLVKRGIPPERATPMAHSIYELQVSKDLQAQTGQDVIKVIRFETEDAMSGVLAKASALLPFAQKLLGGEAKKEEGEKKKSPEEEEDWFHH